MPRKPIPVKTEIPDLSIYTSLDLSVVPPRSMRRVASKLQLLLVQQHALNQGLLRELEEVKTDANKDPLTGLFNRRFFGAELDLEFSRSRRDRVQFSLILIDIDHFKRINDTHGHPVGDRVLVSIGETLGAAMRDTDVCARYGGEEFSAILRGTDAPTAIVLAERLRATIERSVEARSNTEVIKVTASIGVATWDGEESVESLIVRADKALYNAKARGRNRVAVSEQVSANG